MKKAVHKKKLKSPSILDEELRGLFKQLFELQKQKESLGGAPDWRELLKCPNCGLIEDEDCNGMLMVYREREEIIDSGLRFKALKNGKFRCPECRMFVKPQELEFENGEIK